MDSAALQEPAATPAPVTAAEIAAIAARLAPMAASIDKDGIYPTDIVRALGAAGAFSGHIAPCTEGDNDLGGPIAAMADIGRVCMSTAFCMWCQATSAWYLANSFNPSIAERLLPGISSGAILGGTGLSNPVKAMAGIERFKLKASRVAGGYQVSGTLPWVSNLADGHWFGTIFEDAADPGHKIMGMVECGQSGVAIRHDARFIALEGTGTLAVHFDKAFIADEQMLADPLGGMIPLIKAGFILLQTGMGLGVIQGCIDLMNEANRTLIRTNRYLPKQAGEYADDLAELRTRIMRLAKTPHDSSTAYMRGVLQARLDTSNLALAASQAALLHHGSRGYLEGSAVSRRMRESYFVAIISPSIRHLHQELESLDRH